MTVWTPHHWRRKELEGQTMDQQACAERILVARGKEGPRMNEIQIWTPTPISLEASDWCFQAQKIVAYPEDFGMTRQQVGGLARMLADRREQFRGPAPLFREGPEGRGLAPATGRAGPALLALSTF